MRLLSAVLVALLLAPVASALAAVPAATGPLPALPVTTDLGSAKVYPTYPLLTEELANLAAEHKDILRLHSAGKTARGLELWYVEVADFENAEKVPLADREVLYIDGGTHANEYIGVIFVMHLLRWLATGYEENETATWVVQNRHTYILPLANPEGSMNGVGRLNDNLINVNRNFPVGWGDVAEDPVVNNGGPYPGSEKETQAITALWAQIRPDYVLSIHCCGNLWLYPYGIEGREPHADDNSVFVRLCDEVLFDVRDACGPTWSTIYPASGITSDSGYEMAGAFSMTFEMSGRQSEPFPWGPPAYTTAIEELEVESWRAVQHAFLNVHRYGAHPNATVVSVDAGAVRLAVANDGWGNLTSATVTLVDAAGIVREAAVPRLAPGESATVTLPGNFAAGTFPVSVEYAKRAVGGLGLLTAPLSIVGEGAALAGAIGGALPLSAGESPANAVPLPAVFAALSAFALVGLLRRRA